MQEELGSILADTLRRGPFDQNYYKDRYTELLLTAQATGELEDWRDRLYIDRETGILCAEFNLRLPYATR